MDRSDSGRRAGSSGRTATRRDCLVTACRAGGSCCHQCGEPFDRPGRSDRKYCSKRCANAAYWARRYPREPTPAELPCQQCGAVFQPTTVMNTHYCSRACKRAADVGKKHARLPMRTILCAHCGSLFRQRHPSQIYCQAACRVGARKSVRGSRRRRERGDDWIADQLARLRG